MVVWTDGTKIANLYIQHATQTVSCGTLGPSSFINCCTFGFHQSRSIKIAKVRASCYRLRSVPPRTDVGPSL